MKRNNRIRHLALVVAILMIAASIPFSALANSNLTASEQSSIDALREKQAALETKIADANTKIASLSTDKENQQAYAEQLTLQLNNLNEQIDVLNASISAYEADIDKLTENIKANEVIKDNLEEDKYYYRKLSLDLQQLQDDTLTQLLDRLRYLYMTGESSELEALLDSNSLYTFLLRLELMNGIAEHDSNLIDTIKSSMEGAKKAEAEYQTKVTAQDAIIIKLEEDTNKLTEEKSAVVDSRSKLEETQTAQNAMYNEAMNNINALDKQSEEYAQLVQEYNDDRESFDAEIDQLIAEYSAKHAQEASIAAQVSAKAAAEAASRAAAAEAAAAAYDAAGLNDTTVYTTGAAQQTTQAPVTTKPVTNSSGLIHPLSQYSDVYISSGYGGRNDPATGVYKEHLAIDLCCYSGTSGKNVVAAASGTVVTATWHSSYGYYVLIDHGNNVYTLCAHNNELVVSTGDYVTQGQVISHAGSTGYATGAHVHFEVRVNGVKVNPLGYVSIG